MTKINKPKIIMVGLALLLSMALSTDIAAADTIPEDYHRPADTAGLQVVELMPHSNNCSPVDTDLLCNDYIKLFNGADTPINLTDYRLRTSYGGLNASSRNTISLGGILGPGDYELINGRDDGLSLNLTQSGGYVWFEDAYGVQAYEPVIEYPDASSDSRVGQAWAMNRTDWQWTDSPQPDGPNDFPAPTTIEPIEAPVLGRASASLKPCAPDQYRNPSTNRCRKIISATKSLTPCKPGQVRSLDTNRCRTAKTSSKSLTPCKPDQTRNPTTNRCHSLTMTTKSKKPCKPNQERNPDTGRCRKIQPKISRVHDIKTASHNGGKNRYLIAAICVGIAMYILYEWRQEFPSWLEHLKARARFMGRQNARNLLK